MQRSGTLSVACWWVQVYKTLPHPRVRTCHVLPSLELSLSSFACCCSVNRSTHKWAGGMLSPSQCSPASTAPCVRLLLVGSTVQGGRRWCEAALGVAGAGSSQCPGQAGLVPGSSKSTRNERQSQTRFPKLLHTQQFPCWVCTWISDSISQRYSPACNSCCSLW